MVEVLLSHPWTGPDGTDHEVGERLDLDVDWASKVVHAGAGKFATKNDAKAAGGNPDDFTQTASVGLPAEVRAASKRSKARAKTEAAARKAAAEAQPE
jgi:hypothetical protein